MKFRKWTLLNHSNLINKDVLSTVDSVLFKSPFGHFLKVTEEGLFANSSFVEDSCCFRILASDRLPFELWEVTRPLGSQIYLDSTCLNVLKENELFFNQVNYVGESQKKYKFDSVKDAEVHIIGEIIYALSSN